MKGERTAIAVCVCLLFVLVLFVSFYSLLSPEIDRVEWERQEYKIVCGDTLWGIAKRHCPESVDIREWIVEVQNINNMRSCDIFAGDTIIILVPRG